MIHETHQIEPIEIDGNKHVYCTVCGGMMTVLETPCLGKAPKLEIIDDGNIIAIQWSFPEGGPAKSVFPQPLVTVDLALDGRPTGVVFAGARARELRSVIAAPSEPLFSSQEIEELKKIVRSSVKWIDVYKGGPYIDKPGGFASRMLAKMGIKTHLDDGSGKVTFE